MLPKRVQKEEHLCGRGFFLFSIPLGLFKLCLVYTVWFSLFNCSLDSGGSWCLLLVPRLSTLRQHRLPLLRPSQCAIGCHSLQLAGAEVMQQLWKNDVSSGTESRHGLCQLQWRLQVCYMPVSVQLGVTICQYVTIQNSSDRASSTKFNQLQAKTVQCFGRLLEMTAMGPE